MEGPKGEGRRGSTFKCRNVTGHFFLLKKDEAKTKLPNADNKLA